MLQKATAAATAEAADAAFCGAVASKPHPFACLAPSRAEEAGNDTNIDKAAFAAEAGQPDEKGSNNSSHVIVHGRRPMPPLHNCMQLNVIVHGQ